MILKMLKMTSVMASCARAWTLEFLMRRHQSQQRPLTPTVLDMITMAEGPSWRIVVSPEVKWLKH